MKMENLLLKCVSGADYTDELNEVTDFYGEDLNKELLELQLTILGSNLTQEACTLIEIVTYLKSLPRPGKDLLSEVSILMKLILVMPATNATSERSFSALKRIKSYLCSTIKQECLNSLMTIHVHKDKTDKLELRAIGNEFVAANAQRTNIFGTFSRPF